jgi:acetyl-CoA C-acetyltransferase
MSIRVAGTGLTKFGELWSNSLEDLLREASFEAIAESKFPAQSIEAVFVANMGSGMFEGQLHLGALVSSFFPHLPPGVRIEGACASGGLALLQAEYALLSGQYETVLVVGAEKMTDVSATEGTQVLAAASHFAREYGSTFPALYGLIAQAHMEKHGTTRQQLSDVSAKNHSHGRKNPLAQFQKNITAEEVSKSTLIADPLRLLDCSPLSDGAAAVILTTKNAKNGVYVRGFGHGMDTLELAQRSDLTTFSSTRRAMELAQKMSGISVSQIEAVELHDCFTIAELVALEDLGFFPPGEAGRATSEGQTTFGGRVVVNPSGGLKASGHPVGATGVKQMVYLSRLLHEKTFHTALTHNVGGSGATAVVHILEVA